MPAMASRTHQRVGRWLAALLDRWDALVPEPLRTRTVTWALAVIFAIVTVERTIRPVQPGTLAIDLASTALPRTLRSTAGILAGRCRWLGARGRATRAD